MKQDLLTVMWKERKGLFQQGGSRLRPLMLLFIVIVMISILMPLQMGEEWLNSAWSLLAALVLPLILVGTTVPESFAGERERHTLSTLLASRLPDRAILFGKLSVAMIYGWGLTLILLVLSAIVANIVAWQGSFAFYPPLLLATNVGASLLMSLLVASLGVVISLRSTTVQGAQQALIFALLIPLMAMQVLPMILISVVPDGRAVLKQLTQADFTTVIAIMASVLLLANALTIPAALARFKRARLILD